MAQVKLGFRTVTGAMFVVSRSMSLTIQRNGARKYKSLESSLLMIKDGERTAMSARVGGLFYPLYYSDKVIHSQSFVTPDVPPLSLYVLL